MKRQDESTIGMRALSEEELERAAHVKTISDTKRLMRMLPAWVKRHMLATALPKVHTFKPDQPPRYPSWCTIDHSARPERVNIPPQREYSDVREYVRAFDEVNRLKV